MVLKGQLGFNNPQTESNRFSLRRELYRILPTVDPQTAESAIGDQLWTDVVRRHRVDNILDVPDFERFARPFFPQQAQEPGFVFSFGSTINFGSNFFGLPLAAGDSAYDSSNFATKVRSVGVWFEGYENAALSQTPRVYLYPVGIDIFRSPTPGAEGRIREWKVLDQALPVPFLISGSDLANPRWIPSIDSLLGQFGEIRRFSSFRAYVDGGIFSPDEVITDSRLIGRSVWNTRWVLIVPAGTLLDNREAAMTEFIENVSDIKIFFQTYAFSGN